jgi:glycosyltransferase involved in cell wall biosynthesis
MIPTYNPGAWLRKTLESVMAQDPGPERMQLEVVDNGSSGDGPEPLLREVCGARAAFYRRPKNEGAVANFNECVQRSQGHLVHILHSDDYVLPGFYAEIERLARLHAEAALLATRCFFVDEEGVITDVTVRLPELERGGRAAEAVFYETPLQFPGVVIRRGFYEAHGGYIPSLAHVPDREMWARAVSLGGGVVSPEVLACYRRSGSNYTAELMRSGENIHSLLQLEGLFRERHPGFSGARARRATAEIALRQARTFQAANDPVSARTNWRLWLRTATWQQRAEERLRAAARWLFGRNGQHSR